MAIRRVLRDLRGAFPSRTLAGRLSAGDGPAEFVPLEEILSAQLDEFFPNAARGSIIYKGATDWTVLPPGTDGEVLTTHGVADPTWEAASGGGNWWFQPPLLADFTGVDVGTVASTAETDDDDIGLSIYTELTTADSARLLTKTAPSAPFSIRAKVMVGCGVTGGTGPVCGLMVRNSGTGQRFVYGIANTIGAAAHTRGFRQVTGTTFNAGGAVGGSGGPGQIWGGEVWFRIDISAGLAATVYVSADGKNWHSDATFTQANTVGAGLDQVGFCVSKLDGGGPDSISMAVQFYDEL